MRRTASIALAALVLAIAGGLTACGDDGGGSTTTTTPAVVDGDHASDCWAKPDASGSRHCATERAPRGGFDH